MLGKSYNPDIYLQTVMCNNSVLNACSLMQKVGTSAKLNHCMHYYKYDSES